MATRAHKIELWIALSVALLAVAGTVGLIHWQRRKPISLWGAVLIANADPHKQQPISGVTVSAGDLAVSDVKSNSTGLFVIRLRKPIRKGHPLVLSFRAAQYRPLDLKDVVSNKLYVVHLVPISNTPTAKSQSEVKVANVRVRYTVRAMTDMNVGSAVKTFEVENKGDVPCEGQTPCSPDGRWKAAINSATLDAGSGNQFRNARASCIAGPCPFTRIREDRISQNGETYLVSALNWSNTTTFLLEAEVFRPMVSQSERWSYPVIFGDGMSFTLPGDAQSVSIEADVDGQTIIFPLGPTLLLSWAVCDETVNADKGRIYRCTPKVGYRFQ
ncbi:MAG: hypothetical protein WB817_19470 [Terriglobales bacterium]